jgi:hypothetical protein
VGRIIDEVTTMLILITTMFLLLPVLVTFYLYVSGVFINRRAFQFSFSILLAYFALTMGISMSIQYSY